MGQKFEAVDKPGMFCEESDDGTMIRTYEGKTIVMAAGAEFFQNSGKWKNVEESSGGSTVKRVQEEGSNKPKAKSKKQNPFVKQEDDGEQ